MSKDSRHIEWTKLPVTLDAPGFKKASDEFTFTFATAKKYLDPYINTMQAKLGMTGVLYFVPCTPDQVEALLKENGSEAHPHPVPLLEGDGAPQDRCFVPLDLMAQVLGVDPRTVQLDAEKGLLVRTARGQYDTLASCATLRKAMLAAATGASDAYNDERTKGMRLKRQERELNYLERAGTLVSAEAVGRAIEKAKAAEKQRLLFLPKQLAPQLEGDAAEREALLEEWVHGFLKAMTEIDLSDAGAPAPDQDKPVEVAAKKRKRRKRKKQ